MATKISQLPANQKIGAFSGTINVQSAIIGNITPEVGNFTNVKAIDPTTSMPVNGITIPCTGSIVVGDSAGVATTATDMTGVGYHALAANTTGIGNTAVGYTAGAALTTGTKCTAIGTSALSLGATNPFCTAIGWGVLQNNVFAAGLGGFNTGVGANCLNACTNGSSNTAVGVSAGSVITSGGDNSLFGQIAGGLLTTGGANTFVGLNSGGNVTTGSSNICIGKLAQTVSGTASFYLNIGGIIRGDMSINWLQFNGGRINATRVVTAAGAVTVALSDYNVIVNKGTGAATVVNLPATPETGREFFIKDGKGDAAANNITITPAAGNIDGASTLVISTNYGHAHLVYNGTQWNVV